MVPEETAKQLNRESWLETRRGRNRRQHAMMSAQQQQIVLFFLLVLTADTTPTSTLADNKATSSETSIPVS